MEDVIKIAAPFFIFPLVALGFMWALKLLDGRRTSFNEDDQMISGKNLAVSLRKSGMYLGLAFGLAGTFFGPSHGLATDLTNFMIAGIVLLVLLFVAFVINDKVILCRVDGDKSISEGNTAVGLVEFASYLSSGIIMHGAFSGEGGGLPAAAVFFLLGQAGLVIAFYLLEALTPRNICEEIELRQNAAAGMDVAGMLIALSIILRSSLAGPFTGWVPGLKGFGLYLVAGLIALAVFRFLGNRIFVPGSSYDQQISVARNLPAATLSSVVQVGLALVIAGTF
ncbi:MAG: DUF350 domain-containing protein [Syntrophobacteraceae bacterium]